MSPDRVMDALLAFDLSPSSVTRACIELESGRHPMGLTLGLRCALGGGGEGRWGGEIRVGVKQWPLSQEAPPDGPHAGSPVHARGGAPSGVEGERGGLRGLNGGINICLLQDPGF